MLIENYVLVLEDGQKLFYSGCMINGNCFILN